MLLAVLLVLVGFLLLVKGADLLVEGASHLAYALGMTPLFVGLTIVTFGTTSPELAINLLAARGGNADIALGNVIGSNITNMALILGVSALVHPLRVASTVIIREIPFLFLTSLALWLLVDDARFQPGGQNSRLGRGDGLILLLFFSIFLYYLVASARASRGQEARLSEGIVAVEQLRRPLGAMRASGMVVWGLAGVILGAHWVVSGSVTLATFFGWSAALIGVTIVAVGTSLPELATAITAARRQATDVAVGNLVGSCIYNNLVILGVTSTLLPLRVAPVLIVDLKVMLAVAVALFFVTLRGRRIERGEGLLLFLGYVVYMLFVVWRG